ncbi:MAG: cupin domain-containing protein [Sinobacteraceae bacterium]|nr:cupin domain-containing protein [Nevskiaceae bacterium]
MSSSRPAALLLALPLMLAARALAPEDFVRITPAAVRWVSIPGSEGAQMAVLFGDPDKTGPYVIRVRFPPHVMDRPHFHPRARYVTVLQGTWYAGTGNTFDLSHAMPLPAGSFMVHPAGAAHWDGSASDEPVIVQIVGEGPGTTTLVDASQPMWLKATR